jgi:hypothetical protein
VKFLGNESAATKSHVRRCPSGFPNLVYMFNESRFTVTFLVASEPVLCHALALSVLWLFVLKGCQFGAFENAGYRI